MYEKLAQISEKNCTRGPFCEAYRKIIEKAEEVGIEKMPLTKAGQNQNIGHLCWDFFKSGEAEKMQSLLQKGQYVPQEILSMKDF